jgi:hypothetical protein
MKISHCIKKNEGWTFIKGEKQMMADLVFCFGDKKMFLNTGGYAQLGQLYPGATIIATTTSGEINNIEIDEDSMVATAVQFSDTNIVPAKVNIKNFSNSIDAGKALIKKLNPDGLRFVFVLSDGELVNGDDLVTGMNEILPKEIPIAGGLAGDGIEFKNTLVGLNDDLCEGNIVAIGFYGEKLQIQFGTKGGWSKFGPTRTITKAEKNVLFEIDGNNALDLYKTYLGDYAEKLPASALLFPLAIQEENGEEVVRTILKIDVQNKSMTFAGNLPIGSKVRFMKTTLDNLVNAASDAALMCTTNMPGKEEKLSILISCVGRKIIFGKRIDEEFDAVRESLGNDTVITGFYSYGEIAPFSTFHKCQLHNQTMTITTLSES